MNELEKMRDDLQQARFQLAFTLIQAASMVVAAGIGFAWGYHSGSSNRNCPQIEEKVAPVPSHGPSLPIKRPSVRVAGSIHPAMT